MSIVHRPAKGERLGECARTACRTAPATWYSDVERRFYCQPCALKINEWLPPGVAPLHRAAPSAGASHDTAQSLKVCPDCKREYIGAPEDNCCAACFEDFNGVELVPRPTHTTSAAQCRHDNCWTDSDGDHHCPDCGAAFDADT